MKVEKIKKTGKKYKVVFDDKTEIKTYDDVIINNGLLYNHEIDLDILNKLNIDTNYYDLYYKTINFITRKLRSEKEVNAFIDKNNVNEKDKKEVIKKLKEIGFINDTIFVKAYVSDRINLSCDGPLKVKKYLLEHDIPIEIIEEAIEAVDEEQVKDKLSKLINKKVKNSKYSGYVLRQKIINDFINLGYDKQMINEVFDNSSMLNGDLIKKEYDKLYRKYSSKYSGKELEGKIKNKLYLKGFTMDEINNIQYFCD